MNNKHNANKVVAVDLVSSYLNIYLISMMIIHHSDPLLVLENSVPRSMNYPNQRETRSLEKMRQQLCTKIQVPKIYLT